MTALKETVTLSDGHVMNENCGDKQLRVQHIINLSIGVSNPDKPEIPINLSLYSRNFINPSHLVNF